MLSRKTLLLIRSIYDSLHLLTPNSKSIPSLNSPTWQPQVCLLRTLTFLIDLAFKTKSGLQLVLTFDKQCVKKQKEKVFTKRDGDQELKTFHKETSKVQSKDRAGLFTYLCYSKKTNTVITSRARHCQLAEEFYWPNINMFEAGYNRNHVFLPFLRLLLGQSCVHTEFKSELKWRRG